MRPITFGLLMMLVSGVLLEQSLYSLIFTRAEVIRYNTSYVDFLKTHNFKYNRTQAVTNITVHFLREVDGQLKVQVQAYKMASNEYREFPLRFAFDFCASLKSNDFGFQKLVKVGNFSGCPIKKGWIHVGNFAPDGKRFPPLVPQGSYMLDLKLFHYDAEVIFVQGYGLIEYPLV